MLTQSFQILEVATIQPVYVEIYLLGRKHRVKKIIMYVMLVRSRTSFSLLHNCDTVLLLAVYRLLEF